MITKTSFPRENLCAVAIQNFDVATVEPQIRKFLFHPQMHVIGKINGLVEID